MADIKAYRPKTHSLSSGQVLPRDYSFGEAELVVKEMADALALSLTRNGLETTGVTLYVLYSGKLGLPPVRGSVAFPLPTNGAREIVPAVARVYERITDRRLPIRRLNLTAENVTGSGREHQLTFGDLLLADERERTGERYRNRGETANAADLYAERERERDRNEQAAIVEIQRRYGKNALLKGMDFGEAATTRERNGQIGGHKK